jgi:hypothetical protein|tara:strand:+ start:475 stop:786 length:312 start_codon:yes stop_codon:yes gene_type:complete
MKKIKMIILRWALRLAISDNKHREAILRHELNHLAMERFREEKVKLGIVKDQEINVWHPLYDLDTYDEYGVNTKNSFNKPAPREVDPVTGLWEADIPPQTFEK